MCIKGNYLAETLGFDLDEDSARAEGSMWVAGGRTKINRT